MDKDKKKIIKLFKDKVKGKRPDTTKANTKHSGKEGHWLEKQMGISQNADNAPDLYDYEMKNNTRNKTTFGDWSADFYIWKNKKFNITKDDFLRFFGKPNEAKNGRFSWSGEPCPTIKGFNKFGQRLLVDKNKNIVIEYNYTKDTRGDKANIVPVAMQIKKLKLAQWDVDSIREKVENKFNKKGWFKCIKDSEGLYSGIVFGAPITFENWIEAVKKGDIFFDSGMYQGNARNYSQWRATNAYWDNLVTDRH